MQSQARPIQPPDAEDAEEKADAAIFASLSRDDASLVVAIASAGKGYVRPRGSTLSGLRRLRELGLVELMVDTRGETLAEFTDRGRRAVPHALKVRVSSGGARGLSA